jgi:hypothetical protein
MKQGSGFGFQRSGGVPGQGKPLALPVRQVSASRCRISNFEFRISDLRSCLAAICFSVGTTVVAGPFADANGSADEPKVAHNDPGIVAWATGWADYVPGANCDATWQTPEKALGPAGDGQLDGLMDIVCLGDGGRIAMTFDHPIHDGEGWDFAVFENSFSDNFLELAFVEVSTDGVTFVRFDNCSRTPAPVTAFGTMDPSNIAGLAGKYKGGFGLGFDLAALAGKIEVTSGQVRLNEIHFVRIVDIVGDGNTLDQRSAAWRAAHGPNGPIYDPYPTNGSAGFDLDAVGVRHLVMPGFRVSATELAVAEAGGEEAFTVVLTAPPDRDVVLNLASSQETLATATPPTLTFTTGNWFTPQAVTVVGIDNASVGDHAPVTVTVTVNAAASDPEFAALDAQAVAVSVVNDDFTLTLTVVGDGLLDVGLGDHVLGTHNQPFAIAATPDDGHLFHGWTVTATGANFATDKQLVIAGLAADLALTANFAAYHRLSYAASAGGSLSGPLLQTVIHGQDATPVEATADAGHHLVTWSDGLPAALRHDTGVTADLAVTATFAINEYTVTFRTDGTRGPTVNGLAEVSFTVSHGDGCPPVTAAATPAGLEFTGWSGGTITMDNPLTLTHVTADLTIIANFGRRVAVGSVFEVLSEQVFGRDEDFMAKPKILATFTHPVTGKPGKATVKLLTKASAKDPQGVIGVEWSKAIRLGNMKALTAAQKAGTGAAAWLASDPAPQAVLDIDLAVSIKQGDPVIVGQPLFRAMLPPPAIAAITPGPDDAKGNPAWLLTGSWFGIKLPKAYREVAVPGKAGGSVVIKRQKLKVVKPTADHPSYVGHRHLDGKDKPACMDPATGESALVVLVPPAPKTGNPGDIVIDNGVGIAAVAPGEKE